MSLYYTPGGPPSLASQAFQSHLVSARTTLPLILIIVLSYHYRHLIVRFSQIEK